MIHKHAQLAPGVRTVKRSFVRKAEPECDFSPSDRQSCDWLVVHSAKRPHFVHYAGKLAQSLRNTILVDQVVYDFEERQKILELLEEHITSNMIKVLLFCCYKIVCNFSYGRLETSFIAR